MKQFGMFMLAAVCAAAVGCGSNSPSSPSTTNPTTVTFTSQLRPSNEVPAVGGAESTGTGTATITFHLTRDAGGAIQSGTVDFQFTLTGFPAGTNIILAHIHGPAAAGANANVLIGVTGLSPATPLALANGSGSFQVNGVAGSDAATMQAIIDNPANYYFNVHSSSNSGGVARGQLAKQ
jgi:hypothetical protein